MHPYRCVYSVSLSEHSITIGLQLGDKRGGLLALNNLSTNQGIDIPPLRRPSLHPPLHPPSIGIPIVPTQL